jgi:GDP-mannose transporter
MALRSRTSTTHVPLFPRALPLFAIAAAAGAGVAELPDTGQCAADDASCDASVVLLQSNLVLEAPAAATSMHLAPASPAMFDRANDGVHRTMSSGVALWGLVAFIPLFFIGAAYYFQGSLCSEPEAAYEGAAGFAVSNGAPSAAAEGNAAVQAVPAKTEEEKKETDETTRETPPVVMIVCFVIAGSLCASMLTLVNKWALRSFHKPVLPGAEPEGYLWSLVVIQFLSAALTARLAGASGAVAVTGMEFRKAMAFFPAAGMFMLTIAAGNSVLNYSNVNTFLVLRSLVPLPCFLAETIVYSDPWPPGLSGVALLVTVAGAAGYCILTGGFELRSISWAVIFLVMMPIDALLIKHSISSLEISSWGLVYYNNLLAALPALVYVFLFEVPNRDAFSTMCEAAVSSEARFAIALSCVMGVAISYFQLNTRLYVSATAFMVLGVVNKFATVLVNNFINDKQGVGAFLCIVVSLGGAVLWQLTVQGGSIKVRSKDSSWEKNAFLPFGMIICGLIWAGYVQWRQVASSAH